MKPQRPAAAGPAPRDAAARLPTLPLLARVHAPPSNAQLNALLDAADEALLLFDARLRLSYCNRAATALLGCEAGQAADTALAGLDDASRAELLQALRAGDAAELPALRLADGTPQRFCVDPGAGAGCVLRAPALPPPPLLGAAATGELVRLLWERPQPLLVQDTGFAIVAANRAFRDLFERAGEPLVGQDPVAWIASDDRAALAADRDELLAALRAGRQPRRPFELRLLDRDRRLRSLRCTPSWVSADDGSPLLLTLLDERDPPPAGSAGPADELPAAWFDASPVAMLAYDAAGRVLRSNAAFEALVGATPAHLHEAAPELAQLLAWAGSGPHPELVRDGQPLESRASVALADGRRLRLRARLQATGVGDGGLCVLAVVDDRSLEHENDLAQLEIGALMDTAGVGVATYEPLRGWRNSRPQRAGALSPASALPAGLQAIGREQVEPGSRDEFDRLQQALREGRRAQLRYAVSVPGLGTRWLLTRVEPGELAGGGRALSVVTLDVTEQEEANRRNEQLLRERELMFTLSDVGVAYLRNDGIERANEALARLTGHAVDELLRMPLAALFDDSGLNAGPAREQQQQSLRATGQWRGERRLRRSDGRLLWVELSLRVVDEARPEAGLICSCVDIDERSRAREAMQLQAERTRAILDSVLVGIVTVGDGGIEWMNRSARRMFGGELADFVGEPIAIVATADADHPLRSTHYRDALADGQAETFECRLRGRDGREFWVVGNAVVTGRGAEHDGGGKAQVTFALLDIERRRQAEVSIAQAQASLQRIIETAPLAIALFDAADGSVLRLNQMAAAFIGRPVDAVLGRPPECWFGADDAARLRRQFARALAQTEALRSEWPRPAPAEDGAAGGEVPRVWDMRIVALDAAGSPPQLLLVASDVTEQRVAEQARLEAAIAQREMLVKEVHHRIKNNLQGVAGLLQQTAARRPEVAALIGEVVGQVQAIAQVHGLQVGLSGPLRILPLVEAIAASVRRTFGRGITVAADGAPAHRYALPETEAIPIALTINELLTNAVKHSAEGEIRIGLHCDDAKLSIAVHNPGRLPAGFDLAQVSPGVSGLGLVRALLPRRSATMTLAQAGDEVEARVDLRPPGILLLEPL